MPPPQISWFGRNAGTIYVEGWRLTWLNPGFAGITNDCFFIIVEIMTWLLMCIYTQGKQLFLSMSPFSIKNTLNCLRPWPNQVAALTLLIAHINLYLNNPHQVSVSYPFSSIDTIVNADGDTGARCDQGVRTYLEGISISPSLSLSVNEPLNL